MRAVSVLRRVLGRLVTACRAHPVLVMAGATVTLALGAVFVLTDDVTEHNGLTRADGPVLNDVTVHRTAWLIDAARVLSDIGTVGVLAVLAVAAGVLLWWRGTKPVLAAAPAAALLVAGACTAAGKIEIGRIRPPAFLHLVSESDASFPSGHATDATALFVALSLVVAVVFLASTRARTLLVGLGAGMAVAVGLSRLELGVHWPTDVLAGWSVGLAAAVAVVTVAALVAGPVGRRARSKAAVAGVDAGHR